MSLESASDHYHVDDTLILRYAVDAHLSFIFSFPVDDEMCERFENGTLSEKVLKHLGQWQVELSDLPSVNNIAEALSILKAYDVLERDRKLETLRNTPIDDEYSAWF